MGETLDAAPAWAWIETFIATIEPEHAELGDLDRRIGDGDFGNNLGRPPAGAWATRSPPRRPRRAGRSLPCRSLPGHRRHERPAAGHVVPRRRPGRRRRRRGRARRRWPPGSTPASRRSAASAAPGRRQDDARRVRAGLAAVDRRRGGRRPGGGARRPPTRPPRAEATVEPGGPAWPGQLRGRAARGVPIPERGVLRGAAVRSAKFCVLLQSSPARAPPGIRRE